LLESQPLVYLGKISYGLYLYHGFVTWAMARVLHALHCEPRSSLVYFLPRASVTVFVAAVSWHLIERPVSRLKRSFGYAPEQSKQPRTVSVAGD
jgi:peptidoglycan/LPS O-acetylase OafA/YrhL